MPTLATIATKINGSLIDVPHANFAPHQHLQIYHPNNPITLNQTWTIVDNSDGGVPIPPGYVNIFAGNEPTNLLCIDIPDSLSVSRTLVQLYPVNGPGGTPNQQWKLIPVTDSYVYIASALDNNLVLDVRGGGGADHTQVQIHALGNAQPNQLWFLNSP